MKILKINDKMVGFIEYVPANQACRPLDAPEFMFIHCITVYSKKDRNKGIGSILIAEAEKDAKVKGLSGICTMTSKDPWVAEKDIFENNDFIQIEQKGRFELLSKKWNDSVSDPKLIDWTANQNKYRG